MITHFFFHTSHINLFLTVPGAPQDLAPPVAPQLPQAAQGGVGDGRGLLRGGEGGQALRQGEEAAGHHGHGRAGLPHGKHGQASLRDDQGGLMSHVTLQIMPL